MLLPQKKEREYRFKLALRMGLPIFALIIAFVSYNLIGNYEAISPVLYLEAIILLVFSIYFFLYIIYSGYEIKITDDVSKTFTREYLYKYIKKELKKSDKYTLVLISIDNLDDINTQYGIKNGDNVLEQVALWIATYLKSQKIENFPFGHIKGGDFVIGLSGIKDEYSTILELMCLKSSEFKINNIEINISGAISNTEYSKDLDYIIENLFEIQEERKNLKNGIQDNSMSPNELESFVVNAIDKKSLVIMSQDVFMNKKSVFKECFVKLKNPMGKLLHPKSYMKVINRLGLSLDYDLMILEELILKVESQKDFLYAINIAPSSLRNEKFLLLIKKNLKITKIKIMFILSETEYFSHTSRYNNIINFLRNSGILIAIDRLGSIHTSFLYLRELNIDVIRFDTYYSNENKIKENSNIIAGFNLMAHERGVKSWIKNIEDKNTLDIIEDMKIDYKQGKYLSNLEKIYEN